MKKYEKIAEWIRDEVEAGALSLGDKLPPENELMAQFQVSRQTVRTALSLLRKEGIVEGRRGSGSYITANVHRRTGKEIRIAVLLTCVDSYIFPALLRGMEAGLSREGCTLQISVTENAVEKQGRAAAEKIAACVKHGVKMDTQEFDPRLVIRNSVRMKTGEERKEEHAGTIKERSL